MKNIDETLEMLCDLHPDFISVTFGEGGSTVDNQTGEKRMKACAKGAGLYMICEENIYEKESAHNRGFPWNRCSDC